MRLFLLFLFLFANNVIAENNDKEIIEYLKINKIQTIDNKTSHVCHLNNVYVRSYENIGFRRSIGFMSIVWNNKTKSPLLCKDYEEYIRNIFNKEKEIY